MHIFSRYIYFIPYHKQDLLELLRLHSPESLDNPNLESAIAQCGGHIQLLQLILRSATPNNLLHDPYITLLFKQIVSTLTKRQQTMLSRVAENKPIDIDTYLMNIGIVRQVGNELILFSTLLKDYFLEKKSSHLSAKELLLFNLLKKSNGKIISKEKIFETVWKNDPEGATDWALDSLIYRLRKHPLLQEKGLDLVNHKKLGYQLVRE